MNPLQSIDPELYSLVSGSSRVARQPRREQEYLSQEDERSVLGKLRDGSIGTLAAAGNILDLPGSMVRDTLAGQNPFDQLLPWNWTSPDGRTSGRDLARQFGVAGRKDTWSNAIGGFAAEVALDPLTYMTFGASALGKAGQGAKAAGLMDDVAKVSARKANLPVGQLGKRQQRLGTTLQDFLDYGDDAARTKAQDLIGSGLDANEKLGGLAGIGVPFMDPMFAIGTGPKSLRAAKKMDDVGSAIRFAKLPGTEIAPVDSVARAFDVTINEAKTKFGQATSRAMFRDKEKVAAEAKGNAIKLGERVRKAGVDREEFGDVLAMMVEDVPFDSLPASVRGGLDETLQKLMAIPGGMDEMRSVANEMRVGLDDAFMRSDAASLKLKALNEGEKEVQYLPRFMAAELGIKGKRDGRLSSTFDPSQKARLDELRNIPGGRVAIKNMLKDPKVREIKGEIAAGTKKPSDLEEYLLTRHGDKESIDAYNRTHKTALKGPDEGWLSDVYSRYSKKKKTWVDSEGRYKALTDKMLKLRPETLEVGLFGNHPLVDYEVRKMAAANAIKASDNLLDALAQPTILKTKDEVLATPDADLGGFRQVRDVIKEAGLRYGNKEKAGFIHSLRKQLGMEGEKTKDIGDMLIERSKADDLLGMMKMGTAQEPVAEWLQIVDGVTNLGKGMWTTVWPAFHVRNRISGMAHNFMRGITSLGAEKDAWNMSYGKDVKGSAETFASNPHLRREAEARGFDVGGSGAGGATVAPTPGPTGPQGGSASMAMGDTMATPGPQGSGFYSKLSRAVDSKVGGKTEWNQFQKTMKGAGVKDEEIEDLGLAEFFKAGPRTKKELQEHIERNTPDIEVIEKVSKDGPIGGKPGAGEAQFEGYTIPGGKAGSYREVLIRRRSYSTGQHTKETDRFIEDMQAKHGDGWGSKLDEADKLRRSEINTKWGKQEPGYEGPHWGEKDVIAHVRLDDITNPDGTKTLRVTEMQSDWHQQGRKDGYKTLSDREVASARHLLDGKLDRLGFDREGQAIQAIRSHSDWASRWDVSTTGISEAEQDLLERYARHSRGVLDGPFKKSWSKLAFKQALKMAVEEGYDEVGLVVGRDAARAVGGPVKELDEAYRIMLKDAKEYTKKYQSYVGETEVPGVRNGLSANGGSWGTFGTYEPGFRTVSSRESTSLYRDETGDVAGYIAKNEDGTYSAFNRLHSPVGDSAGYKTQEEARSVIAAGSGYDGGLHIFKITDKMRDDILSEGQSLYMPKATAGKAPVGGEVTDVNSLGTKLDPAVYTKDPAAFRAISEQHKRFGGQIDSLVEGGAIDEVDASVLRLVMSQASPEGLGNLNYAKISPVDSLTNKAGQKVAGQWRWKVGDNGLLQFNIDISKERGATQSGLSVLLHELGHMAHWHYKRQPGNDWGGELNGLIERARKGGRLEKELTELHGEKLGEYLANTFDEEFPQMFADSIMRRKVPKGELGKIISDMKNWIVQILTKMRIVKGIPAPTQKKIDEIIDSLMGFDSNRKLAVNKQSAMDGLPRELQGPAAGMPSRGSFDIPVSATPKPGRTPEFKKWFAGSKMVDEAGEPLQLYHGTRAKEPFTELRPSTGSQDYGPGVYLTRNPAVADDYATGARTIDEMMGTKPVASGGRVFPAYASLTNPLDAEKAIPPSVTDAARTLDDDEEWLDMIAEVEAGKLMLIDLMDSDYGSSWRRAIEKAGFDGIVDSSDEAQVLVFDPAKVRSSIASKSPASPPGKSQTPPIAEPEFSIVNPLENVEPKSSIVDALEDPQAALPGVPPSQVPPVQVPPGVPPSMPVAASVPPSSGGRKKLTDADATQIIRELLASHGVVGKFEGNATDVAGQAGGVRGGSLQDMLSAVVPAGQPMMQPGRVARKFAGMEPGTEINPLKASVRGGWSGATDSTLGPMAAGEEVGQFVEFQNRAAPFMHLLKKGYDPAEASKVVGEAQVQYSNRYFTPFETQVMKRLLPFYSFSSRVAPQVGRELMERPGGRLATVIEAQENLQSGGDTAPDYIRETASFPLGDALGPVPEGTDRYLTGLGLMHEDPFGFGPNAKGAGLEFLSRMNPFVKAPLELATGQSYFQKGPDGGRSLDDMDPLVGRLAANLGLVGEDNVKFLPTWVEQIVANSPIARGLSTARQLTDTRKRVSENIPLPGAASLINTLTGVRITDVSPKAKDAIVRQLLEREMKDEGAAAFERIYFRKEDLAKMEPGERDSAVRLQALANVLAKRAKERKEQRLRDEQR